VAACYLAKAYNDLIGKTKVIFVVEERGVKEARQEKKNVIESEEGDETKKLKAW